MTMNDAATAGGENVCLNCLDNAGISHNGAYKVLSVMGRDGAFHEQLEPCSCSCHGQARTAADFDGVRLYDGAGAVIVERATPAEGGLADG